MKKLLERLNALRTAIAEGIEAHKSDEGVHDWTKVGTIAIFTVPETDGSKEWAKAADATLDFSKMENDAARTTAATGLYDLYDAAKTEVERLQEEEKEAAKAASDLRERTLATLTRWTPRPSSPGGRRPRVRPSQVHRPRPEQGAGSPAPHRIAACGRRPRSGRSAATSSSAPRRTSISRASSRSRRTRPGRTSSRR